MAGTRFMHQDAKVLVILTTALHQQVAVLDISKCLACVATPARRTVNRGRAKYLGILIALAVLLGPSIGLA
jgi:hypothetical protein